MVLVRLLEGWQLCSSLLECVIEKLHYRLDRLAKEFCIEFGVEQFMWKQETSCLTQPVLRNLF